jgi:hypothetical protein
MLEEAYNYISRIKKFREERNVVKSKLAHITDEINSGRYYGPILENKQYYQLQFKKQLNRIKHEINARKDRIDKITDKLQLNLKDIEQKNYDKRQKITQRKALQGRIKEYTVNEGHEQLNKFDDVLKKPLNVINDTNETEENNNYDLDFKMLEEILYKICHESILKDYNDATYNADVVNIQMSIKFQRIKNTKDGKIYLTNYANSATFLMTSKDTIKLCIYATIDEFFKVLLNAESPYKYDKIFHFRYNVAYQKKKLFKNPNAGSYIALPEKVNNSKSCINVKNLDDKCIEYCIMAFLFHNELVKTKKMNDPTRYKKYFDKIKRPDNITYPINLGTDVQPYEKLNDLCINIYQILENNNTFINIYQSKYNSKPENKHLNLLLITDNEKDNSHLVLIKDFSRFSNHFVLNKKNKTYLCENCLIKQFPTKEQCAEHYTRCIKNIQTKVKLPKKGSVMTFQNFNHEFQHPFFCTADFESTLLPIKKEDPMNTEFLQRYQKHVPNSYGIKFNCMHDKYSKPIRINTNPDPETLLKDFVEDLESYAKYAYQLTKSHLNIHDPNFTKGTKLYTNHMDATQCSRCNCNFTETNKKVAHHDHINGNFLSTLCEKCNNNYRYKKFLPVILHNLKGYDSHLFVKALYKYGYVDTVKDNVISCIPNTEQQYISFSKNIVVGHYTDSLTHKTKEISYEIRFIDSFSFMASSIEKIADSIKGKNKEITPKLIKQWRNSFKYCSEQFKNDDQFLTMISKGIYPYDYIDSYDKLNSQTLPSSKDFYSKLNNSSISDKDYKTALNNYKILDCKSFMDYHKYYLTSDVLLLTDIWNNFISKSMNAYNLDPTYYYTAPSLSWDAFLKSALINGKQLELELLSDIDKYNFVESGIRGGLSQISTRYAKANNPDIKNKEHIYVKDIETSQIFYLDANNLYGHAMTQFLPYKNFEWNQDIWTKEKIIKLGDKDDIGYLFEVDLSIHEDLHDYFNNYTPLPINKKVKIKDINQKYTQNITEKQKEKKCKSLYHEQNITKLCCDLSPRKKYVVHYRMLKLALNLGFTLDKVHRVLQFNQAPFMKDYILKNTEFRKQANNDFEKDFYKLLNNSAYGKTMENVRNRIDFKLINSVNKLDKAKRLKRFTIFDEKSDLIGLHLSKCSVTLNKPIYIGQCVLDDSKHLMFDFHYNFVHKHVGIENFNLLFTDTDSLCYHIRNKNFYDIMDKHRDEFDLSSFPKDHRLYDPTNEKVIGKFKVEYSGIELIEFVGLRSKVYSILKDKEKDQYSKKLKGIKSYVVENDITHQKYLDTLRTGIDYYVWQNSIRTFKHEIYTITQQKKALSRSDDKVYICNDNIHTYTHGHKNIPINNNKI